jgi:hypothetical protein
MTYGSELLTVLHSIYISISIYKNTFHRSNTSQRLLDMKLVTINNNTYNTITQKFKTISQHITMQDSNTIQHKQEYNSISQTYVLLVKNNYSTNTIYVM